MNPRKLINPANKDYLAGGVGGELMKLISIAGRLLGGRGRSQLCRARRLGHLGKRGGHLVRNHSKETDKCEM